LKRPDPNDVDPSEPNDTDTTPQGLLPIIAAKKRMATMKNLFERQN
jgi:hypothetical protein